MLTRFRFPFFLLASFALVAAAMASESALSFESLIAHGRNNTQDSWSERGTSKPPESYPFGLYFGLGELLDKRFDLEATLVADESAGPSSGLVTLSLHLAATYEVFWNGELVGLNGAFDEHGQETTPGRSYNTFVLPGPYEPGSRHLLRITGYHTHSADTSHLVMMIVSTLGETVATSRTTGVTYTLFLGFALFGIYLLSYYFIDRREPQYLFLGGSCILFGLYAVNKLFYLQLNVSYPHLDWVKHFGDAINVLLSATAPIAVLLILGFKQRWLLAAAALPYLVSKGYPHLQVVPNGFYLCTLLSFAGLLLRRRHAGHCLLVSIALVCNYAIPYLRYNQGIGFGVLMLYLLVSSIVLLSRESKRRTQAELRNSRLQLELLKSKIQPHFVLNSLTSAIEWIETNPKEGARLIHELAKEFELLAGMSDQQSISITIELESCRSYLRIMEYRKKAKYELKLQNVRSDQTIPPAIFRNLIENAITHNAYGQDHIVFELDQTEGGGRRSFRFSSPLSERDQAEQADPSTDGTGIQYIKARLAESYESWNFRHGRQGSAWVTEIQLPAQ